MTGSTKVTSIDAHSLTGALTVTSLNTTSATTIQGGSGNDVLTAATGTTADVLIGNNGDDILKTNAGLDTLTGGAGNDLFVVNVASANVNSYATITDFAAGDLIQFAGAGSFQSAKVTLGDTAVFQDYANAAINAIGGTGLGWFQYGSNTYIVEDLGGGTAFLNGTDKVVKLTGQIDLTDATFNTTHGTIAL
jgi:S-layer protein